MDRQGRESRDEAPIKVVIDLTTHHVPAGTYTIGAAADPVSPPPHRLTLPAFAIGEIAVTNAQFVAFIEAGGYHEASYWSDYGWRWQQNKQVEHPAFWDDRNFNHPLQPVVGLCWYEADAFCHWLSAVTGDRWQLPSEAEWEAAAAAPDGETIPVEWINSAALDIGRTWAALGRGAVSWCGARDMLGNVWEWTRSRWGRNWQSLDYPYPYDPADGREDRSGSHARVMRGGSWFDGPDVARPTHRGRYLPGSRGSNIGFRIVKDVL